MIGLALAMMLSGAAGQSPPPAQTPKPARFFVDGSKNAVVLAAINRDLRKKIDFAGRYSVAFVACGTGCGDYYFVDRFTGAVISAPGEQSSSISIDDVKVQQASDVATIITGPRDGVGSLCFSQRFRLVGHRFAPISSRVPLRCAS